MKKAIVTGSEGFIGQALVQALQKRGVEVIGIDRKTSQEVKDIVKYMPDDIDVVFHLAAQTSVFNTDFLQIRKDNIDAFMEVVRACVNHPRKPKLVYASSSTANPKNTTSMYGLSKQFDENYALLYLPTATGVRLHNVYGPNPRQGTLLWYLLNKDKVTLYNNGENVRHFTYIDDAVEGLIYAADCPWKLINVANPEIATTRQFAETVQNKLRGDLHIALTDEKRHRDRYSQELDTTLPSAPILYRGIERGIMESMPSENRS